MLRTRLPALNRLEFFNFDIQTLSKYLSYLQKGRVLDFLGVVLKYYNDENEYTPLSVTETLANLDWTSLARTVNIKTKNQVIDDYDDGVDGRKYIEEEKSWGAQGKIRLKYKVVLGSGSDYEIR